MIIQPDTVLTMFISGVFLGCIVSFCHARFRKITDDNKEFFNRWTIALFCGCLIWPISLLAIILLLISVMITLAFAKGIPFTFNKLATLTGKK